MKFDKTCCGTTCDAKANAEYVAKLESFVASLHDITYDINSGATDCWDASECLGNILIANFALIKHAQQNNSTTE